MRKTKREEVGARIAHPPEPLQVGAVARAAGVGVQTLHFYEREGVILPASRTASGYRQYDASVIDRLRFVRKAQALGLSLDEIKQVLSLTLQGKSPCGRVQAALAEKLAEVDRRLQELQVFRDELARLTAQSDDEALIARPDQICAIVEHAGAKEASNNNLNTSHFGCIMHDESNATDRSQV